MDNIEKYITYTPSTAQKKIQRDGFNAFVHYGLNTFNDKEWGNGKTDPIIFNPSEQNTDQWAEAIANAGMKGIIFGCKHHDGFCLWPTNTTKYSVSATPYKNGKGDVVKEISDSCKKFGLNFGVYLSPWDRNHELYSTPAYNDVYCEQLTELLTNYGEICSVWLDGACGAYMDGKTKQDYDFDRFFALIRKLQPLAAISNCGPDVRWVGNEGGIARESEWNVVPKFSYDLQTIEKNSQQSEDGESMKKGADVVFSDLGSRKFLANYNEFMWYPAEVDVSIRPGWFYHKNQDNKVRSLKNLLKIYYTSVGGNSLLLLNIPPDKRGLLHENDCKRLKEMGDYLNNAFLKPLKIATISGPQAESGKDIGNVLTYSFNEKTFDPLAYYTPQSIKDTYEIDIELQNISSINRVRIIENVAFSQRIESFNIYALVGKIYKKVYSGTTIGYNRIAVFDKAVTTQKLKIVIDLCRSKPYIEYIGVYENDGYKLKKPMFAKIQRFFHQLFYKIFIARENKNN